MRTQQMWESVHREIAALRAQVATLTKERDEAMMLADAAKDALGAKLEKRTSERDTAFATVARLKALIRRVEDHPTLAWEDGSEALRADVEEASR